MLANIVITILIKASGNGIKPLPSLVYGGLTFIEIKNSSIKSKIPMIIVKVKAKKILNILLIIMNYFFQFSLLV